jgi:8-oxo-dGTP diphosphatase
METRLIQKAVILNNDGQILMLRRGTSDKRRPGQWDLAGGLREPGEELIPSILREIKEETGLEVKDPQPVYAVTIIKKWSNGGEHTENVDYMFYLAKAVSNDIELSDEHAKFKWQDINAALHEFEYDLHKQFLKHIIDNKLVKTP